MVLKTRTSLAEYLALPTTKPWLELMDGEVFEKPMVNRNHSRLTSRLIHWLIAHLDESGEGVVDTELRHGYLEEEWVFLPDISVTLKGRLPYPPADTPKGPFEVLPDFAIEVVSPDDLPGRLQRRIAHYMRSGVRLLWVVDPEAEKVTVWEPGATPMDYSAPAILAAAPVLPDFELDLGRLFSYLHE